jgi:hypothetical protein
MEELQALGVGLVSLGESIDTTTPAGRLQIDVLSAVAQFQAGPAPGACGCGTAAGEGAGPAARTTEGDSARGAGGERGAPLCERRGGSARCVALDPEAVAEGGPENPAIRSLKSGRFLGPSQPDVSRPRITCFLERRQG